MLSYPLGEKMGNNYLQTSLLLALTRRGHGLCAWTFFLNLCVCRKTTPFYFRFAPLHYIASIFLFIKMPCISQSEWHVAPPLQPLPNSHLHMNLLHSTEPDI